MKISILLCVVLLSGLTHAGRLRAAGTEHVINLRTPEESQGFDEARIATDLGLKYHAIPIAGAQALTKEAACTSPSMCSCRELGDTM